MRIDQKNKSSADYPASVGEGALSFFDKYFPDASISRVLLVNPPDAHSSLFNFEVARRGTLSNFPPYGLAVIAQNLRAMNIEVRIINLNHEVLKECHAAFCEVDFNFDDIWESCLDQEISSFKPELIGVTCMFTMTHNSLKHVCDHAAKSSVPIAIGGVHVTNDVDFVLNDIESANVAFLREADEAIKQFVRAIRREVTLDELAQVTIIENGERHHFNSERRPTEKEIDVIPAFDLMEISNLSQFGVIGSFHFFKPKEAKFATSLSNRGCRASCTFCSVRNFNGKGVRPRSVESLIDELDMLENEYGISHIMWLDDDLFKDHSRAIALFNGMVKRGLKLTWDASNGVLASSCKDEVVSAAADSGCLALVIGMESGNPAILREVRKPATVEIYLEAAKVLQKYEGINSSAYLIIGFPGETMSMIMDTINVSLQMNLDWYRIKTLQPLPNTAVYDTMLSDGLLQDVDTKDVRYMTGAYGKAHEIDRSGSAQVDFAGNLLNSFPMDSIPDSNQLDEIWFFMNYKLNYERVCKESRPIKLNQQLQFIESICEVIAPDNALAFYTKAFLQKKLYGKFEDGLVESLANRLASSGYWTDRFATLGLSPEDIINSRAPSG